MKYRKLGNTGMTVNKYLDLVELDKRPADSVKVHYHSLEAAADKCYRMRCLRGALSL